MVLEPDADITLDRPTTSSKPTPALPKTSASAAAAQDKDDDEDDVTEQVNQAKYRLTKKSAVVEKGTPSKKRKVNFVTASGDSEDDDDEDVPRPSAPKTAKVVPDSAQLMEGRRASRSRRGK
jgi:hypothetical protein